jgi:hypothetical protein
MRQNMKQRACCSKLNSLKSILNRLQTPLNLLSFYCNHFTDALLFLYNAMLGIGNWMVAMGTIGTILMVPPILLSFPFIRNRFYNLFYFSHLFLHVGIVFLWLHASSDLYYMMPAIGLYATDILLRIIARFSPNKVLRVVPSSGGLVRVDFDIRYGKVQCGMVWCVVALPSVLPSCHRLYQSAISRVSLCLFHSTEFGYLI